MNLTAIGNKFGLKSALSHLIARALSLSIVSCSPVVCVYKSQHIILEDVLLFGVAGLRLVMADTGSSFPRDAFAVWYMVSFKSSN